MTRVAVTGAGGFVGGHLLPALRAEGYEVRGLVRPGSPSSLADASETIVGDVRNLESVRSLLADVDIAIHLAASFAPADDVAEIITLGTRNLLVAANDAGIKRLIYLGCMGEEAAGHSSFYRAKWLAEKLVGAAEVPHVILRPSLIVGRNDGVVRPLVETIRSLPVVPIPGEGDRRTQPVLVEDVARCILLALTSDQLENETADIGGPMFITFSQLVDLIGGRIGISKPKARIPLRLLPVVSQLVPLAARQLFQPPRIALFTQGVVASPGVVSHLFGFQPGSILPRLTDILA